MKNVALHNLGCKVNSYEMEVMQQKLQEKGYGIVPFDSKKSSPPGREDLLRLQADRAVGALRIREQGRALG